MFAYSAQIRNGSAGDATARAKFNGHCVDPFGGSTLVVSRLLPAALDRYPRGSAGHVAVPNRSILR